MTLGNLLAKGFARKSLVDADNNVPAADGWDSDQVKKSFQNPLKDFWNLDNEKSVLQSYVTTVFYGFILWAMDSIIFMPFRNNDGAAEILSYVEKFPPSLWVSMALLVITALGREMALYKKVFLIVVALLGGLMFHSFFPLICLAAIMMFPVKTQADDSGSFDEELSSGEDSEDITEDVISTKLQSASLASQEIVTKENTPSRLGGDGEVPDDYVDPLDKFLD